MCVFSGGRGRASVFQGVWRSEDNQGQPVLSFYYVGPGDWTLGHWAWWQVLISTERSRQPFSHVHNILSHNRTHIHYKTWNTFRELNCIQTIKHFFKGCKPSEDTQAVLPGDKHTDQIMEIFLENNNNF